MKRYLWASAVALLSLQGCVTIDDNTDDCFPLVRLRFEYTYNMEDLDLFREQVSSLDLYAYRRTDGSLAAAHHYTQADLIKENYSLALKWLRQDDYYIIAYGNKDEKYYDCPSHYNMADARVKMLCSDGLGTVTENPCHFFYGFTELAKGEKGDKTVSMIKDTNDIKITIRYKATRAWEEGLPDLTFKLALPNGTIKNDNSIDGADTRTMTHISLKSFEQYETSLQTTIRVGRLFGNDGSTINISGTNSGIEYLDEGLTAKIAELRAEYSTSTMPINEYLDRQDVYELVYDLEMENGVYVVTLIEINGWHGIEDPIGGV